MDDEDLALVPWRTFTRRMRRDAATNWAWEYALADVQLALADLTEEKLNRGLVALIDPE